jgi:hypothetical protein
MNDAIEALMDSTGPDAFLATVAQVLRVKADHIRHDWQDKAMAQRFLNAAGKIDKASEMVAP